MEKSGLSYEFRNTVKEVVINCNYRIDESGKFLPDADLDKQIEILEKLVSIAACSILEKIGKNLPKKALRRLNKRTKGFPKEETKSTLAELRKEFKKHYEGMNLLIKKLIDYVDLENKPFDGFEYLYPEYVLGLLSNRERLYEETPMLLEEYLGLTFVLPGRRVFKQELETSFVHPIFSRRTTFTNWAQFLENLFKEVESLERGAEEPLDCNYSDDDRLIYLIQMKLKNIFVKKLNSK